VRGAKVGEQPSLVAREAGAVLIGFLLPPFLSAPMREGLSPTSPANPPKARSGVTFIGVAPLFVDTMLTPTELSNLPNTIESSSAAPIMTISLFVGPLNIYQSHHSIQRLPRGGLTGLGGAFRQQTINRTLDLGLTLQHVRQTFGQFCHHNTNISRSLQALFV
jgi:hypothetical protein